MNIDELLKHESIVLNRETNLIHGTENKGEHPYTFIIYKDKILLPDSNREMHEVRWALWAGEVSSGGIVSSEYKEVNPWVKH